MLDYPTRTDRIGLAFGQFYAPHNVFHPGIDYNYGYGNQDKGQPVITPTEGVVEYVSPRGYNGGLGLYVVVYHPYYGIWTRFLHLDSVSVSIGQILPRETKLGTLGNSGTTSSHLHAEALTWDGIEYVKNWHRPYGRYPVGMSKQEMLKRWIDFDKWVRENNHPPKTDRKALEKKLELARKAVLLANGSRKVRLQRLIDRLMRFLGQ